MQNKGLAWLFGVTVVAVAAAVVVSLPSGPSANPLVGKPVLPEVTRHLGEVGRMTLVHGPDKTTLVRKGNSWAVEERGGYPADDTKVRRALLGLADMRYVDPKTSNPSLYSRLDVEDAGAKNSKSTLVTLTNAKGALLGEVITGKHRADQLGGGVGGVYVRKPGTAQSWLARGDVDLSGNTASWLDKKILDLPSAQVKEAVLVQPDGAKLTIIRDEPKAKFRLVDMPKDKKLKYDSILDDTAGALAGLDLEDVRPAKGFDFPKEGVTEDRFVSFSGLTIAVDLAEKDGKSWARFTATGDGAAAKQAADLNAKVSPWVYALSSSEAQTLRDKIGDLVESAKAS